MIKKLLIGLVSLLVTLPSFASNLSPFAPNIGNNTVALTVTGTTSSASVPSNLQVNYILTNVGTNVVYVSLGAAGSSPTATTTTSLPVLPNSQILIAGPPNMVIAAIASTTGNTLYVTPGEGN